MGPSRAGHIRYADIRKRKSVLGTLSGTVFAVLLWASISTALPSASFPEFLLSAARSRETALAAKFAPSLARLESDQGLRLDSAARARVLPLFFLHALFTTTAAEDCARGGVLGTVYFWHWVEPNPRFDILLLPESKRLVYSKPPPTFGKYKTFAHVDRLPRLYLADAAAETPRYRHPGCGDIHTFGWCSEREMAFNVLLRLSGYGPKIIQEGIHVWSEVVLDLPSAPVAATGGPGRGDKSKSVVFKFDTTFDSVEWEALKRTRAAWAKDFGRGSDVGWYNRVTRSREELDAVRAIVPTGAARKRIEGLIEAWLSRSSP